MLGIPVRVHPMFWLMTVILGWNALERGPIFLVIWVVSVFASILVHELGHVLMAGAFGKRGYIVLYSFGGLAIDVGGIYQRWKRIAVSLAGPGAGFLLLGFVVVSYIAFAERVESAGVYAREILNDLIWINLVWGIVNLLPVWPLDGGHVSREFFTWLTPRNGVRNSLIVSIVTAAALALNSLSGMRGGPTLPYVPIGGAYSVLLFGSLALASFQVLQAERRW
jgi:Zn-dependent protease